MVKKINIEIEQGCSFSGEIDLKNDDSSPFVVAGWSAGGTIRKHYLSNTVYNFTTSLSDGLCEFAMSPALTATIEDGLYVYDIRISSTDGTIHRIASGMAFVSPSATK